MNIYDKLKSGYYSPEYHGVGFVRYNLANAEMVKSYKTYRAKEIELRNEFKKEALEHVNLHNHPKADAIFDKAWEDGHGYGYGEVFNHLMELAELFD